MNRRKFFGSLLASVAAMSMAGGIAANIPAPPSSFVPPVIYLNGVRQQLGSDFQLAGDILRFAEPIPFGSTVLCVFPHDGTTPKDVVKADLKVVYHQGHTTTFDAVWHYPPA
jgi:hypothetical protein